MDDTKLWERRLQGAFGRSVRTTRARVLNGDSDVELRIDHEHAGRQMQTDGAAFEVWALALRIAGATSVKVHVTGDPVEGGHLNRFRYRAHHLGRVSSAWWNIEPVQASPMAGGGAVLNAESSPRQDVRSPSATMPVLDLEAAENSLELMLAHDPHVAGALRNAFGLSRLGRHLPVGVFAGAVSKQNAIFTGGKSAIDLWGVGQDQLVVVELKNQVSRKLGGLTELLFYALVLRDLQRDALCFDPKKARGLEHCDVISKTKSVAAYLLAPAVPPVHRGRKHGGVDLAQRGLGRRAGAHPCGPRPTRVRPALRHAVAAAAMTSDLATAQRPLSPRCSDLRPCGLPAHPEGR